MRGSQVTRRGRGEPTTRGIGQGVAYLGIQKRGSWKLNADTVVFTTDDPIPTFGGERDGDTFVLRFPANFAALAKTPVELRLDLVQAY